MAILRIIDTAIVFLNRNNGRITLLLVLLVFAICLGLSLTSGSELRYPDEHEYDHLAQTILSGDGYRNAKGEPTAFRPPGWPLVLSAIYSVAVSPLAAKIFNCVCLAGSIALLALFIGRINPLAKVFAPLLLFMYPVEFYTATTLYPQTFGAFLLVTIMLLLFGKDVSSAKRTMTAGLVAGILVLAIPSFLLALPLVLVCMLIINKDGIGVLTKHCLILIGCTVLVVAPWTLRNAYVFKAFIPLSTNSGINLLLGNSEQTEPNMGMNVDVSRYVEDAKGLGEVAADRYYRRQALEWIGKHPWKATKLYSRKVLNYFNYRNRLHVKSEASAFKDLIMLFTYYPLLAIAIVRIVMARIKPMYPHEIGMYLIYFGNAFASAVFFNRIRFRMPYDLILIGIVSLAIAHFLDVVRERVEV